MRDREVDVGQLLTQDLVGAVLVRRIHEREQKADGDRFHALLAQTPGGGPDLVLVKRGLNLSGRDDALADGQTPLALDERRVAPRQVLIDGEGHRAPMAPDVDDVAKAPGGDHPRPRAVALDDDVGGHRRAVEHLIHAGRELVRELAQTPQAADGRLRGVGRRTRDLVHGDRAALVVHQHEVGERATHVDPYPDHCAPVEAQPPGPGSGATRMTLPVCSLRSMMRWASAASASGSAA